MGSHQTENFLLHATHTQGQVYVQESVGPVIRYRWDWPGDFSPGQRIVIQYGNAQQGKQNFIIFAWKALTFSFHFNLTTTHLDRQYFFYGLTSKDITRCYRYHALSTTEYSSENVRNRNENEKQTFGRAERHCCFTSQTSVSLATVKAFCTLSSGTRMRSRKGSSGP